MDWPALLCALWFMCCAWIYHYERDGGHIPFTPLSHPLLLKCASGYLFGWLFSIFCLNSMKITCLIQTLIYFMMYLTMAWYDLCYRYISIMHLELYIEKTTQYGSSCGKHVLWSHVSNPCYSDHWLEWNFHFICIHTFAWLTCHDAYFAVSWLPSVFSLIF